MKEILLSGILVLLLGSCKKILFHPDEVRPAEKDLNAKNIERISGLPEESSFKFIVTGDCQQFYDELEDFVRHVNSQPGISFVLLNGDLVDFGMNREYNWVAERLKKLNIPFVAAIGNHDMIGNGELVFRKMFGPENFSFSYGVNKFICLNTNSREKGNDGTVPDIDFLRRELSDSLPQNIFVLSHVPPFNDDFDDKLEHSWAELLEKDPRVRLSMHGHEHKYSYWFPYGKLPYLIVASSEQRNYGLISVSQENFTVEEKFY